jgi:hypothetical protein
VFLSCYYFFFFYFYTVVTIRTTTIVTSNSAIVTEFANTNHFVMLPLVHSIVVAIHSVSLFHRRFVRHSSPFRLMSIVVPSDVHRCSVRRPSLFHSTFIVVRPFGPFRPSTFVHIHPSIDVHPLTFVRRHSS